MQEEAALPFEAARRWCASAVLKSAAMGDGALGGLVVVRLALRRRFAIARSKARHLDLWFDDLHATFATAFRTERLAYVVFH